MKEHELGVTGNIEGQHSSTGTIKVSELSQQGYTLQEALQTFPDNKDSAKFKIEYPAPASNPLTSHNFYSNTNE